jgi:hypothetical protein
MDDRYAYAYDRLNHASMLLLTDQTTEGQTLLHLLIDNELYGDQLITAIEMAEDYLKGKGLL